MSMKSRERNAAMAVILAATRNDPRELAKKMLHVVGAPEDAVPVTNDMSARRVVLAVGDYLAAKRIVRVDVVGWAKRLYEDAALSFDVEDVLVPGQEPATTNEPGTVLEMPKAKKSRRPYLPLLETLLDAGNMTRSDIIARILQDFPRLNGKTLYTFMSDLLNAKYTPFEGRIVVYNKETKIFGFAAAAEEAQAEQAAVAAN